VPEELVAWHDFNVSLVTAAAALLGLLFVALSIHVRTLIAERNAELRSIARSIFLGYLVALGIGFVLLIPQTLFAAGAELLVLLLLSMIPFAAGARAGLRSTGIGFDRRVTVLQFVAGFLLFAITLAAAIGLLASDGRALYVFGGVAVVSLLWGLFNTYELIFRVQPLEP
jgi:hypothetical protein